MKKITQMEFRQICTQQQWEKYVEGLLQEVADRDMYFETDAGGLAFIAADMDGGGGSSHPTLVWSDADKNWEEK